jgi:putative phosphoribosyl transferase
VRFKDRESAGRALAGALRGRLAPDAVLLGLPRGGVVVAAAAGRELGMSVDVLVSRKVGAPGDPELGLGAVAEGGAVWLNRALAGELGLTTDALADLAGQEAGEVVRRAERYRQGRPPPSVAGRTAVLVDDGIATGGTMQAAVRALRAMKPARVVLAAPVAARETVDELRSLADDIVILHVPTVFGGVGAWFDDFRQLDDHEVLQALGRDEPGGFERVVPGGAEQEITVHAGGVLLPGTIEAPVGARGIVLFAHGSGSSHRSERNRAVATTLHEAGLATLLFDLLTPEEELEDRETCAFRFDIGLLTNRLAGAIDWCGRRLDVGQLTVGLFGASTGAAAALCAAALRPDRVAAVVSRGGRPDLAGEDLDAVRAPTLLVVGAADSTVLGLNEEAFARLRCPKRLSVVPGATHLFEEPGALEDVARQAAAWFALHLGRPATLAADWPATV